MKTLHLVRHAKSSWDDASLADHDRPLSRRGERDLPRMSAWFVQRHGPVDHLMSSSATRALATAQAFAIALGRGSGDLVIDPRLYDASAATIREVIAGVPGDVDVLVVFGHNPGMTDLAHQLAEQIEHMPTCAVASLRFDVSSWSDLLRVPCIAVDFETPRTIRTPSETGKVA